MKRGGEYEMAEEQMQETPTEPMAAMEATSMPKKTGSGLDPKVAALLAWLLFPVSSLIFVLIEKEDKFVRFHAYQSLLVWIAVFIAYIISSALTVLLIGLLLVPLVGLASLVIWILGMVKAYQGEMWKLPVIGDMAEEWANK